MSHRRVGPKIKPTSKRTVEDFEKAVIRKNNLAHSSSPVQDQVREAEEALFNARFSLYELIQQLEERIAKWERGGTLA
jgi:hypothetical protein